MDPPAEARGGGSRSGPGPGPGPGSARAALSGVARRPRLLDLPWEDVLVPHILRRLPLRQLLRLQRVSKAFRAAVQLHLANLRRFDASQVRAGAGLRARGKAPARSGQAALRRAGRSQAGK